MYWFAWVPYDIYKSNSILSWHSPNIIALITEKAIINKIVGERPSGHGNCLTETIES